MKLSRRLMICVGWVGASVLMAALVNAQAAEAPKTVLKANSFDQDPGWDSFNNRMKPKGEKTVTQDFGYSKTHFAGKQPGEAGGLIQRASRPAYYGARIEPKTLDDKMTCSGTFAAKGSFGGGGVFFGFFDPTRAGASSRPTNSMGMYFDFEGTGGRIAMYLITAGNKVHGNFVTPYIPGTYRPTPVKNDGSVRYTWQLDYVPNDSDGTATLSITVKGDGDKPANFENRRHVVVIPKELRQDKTTFTHFGVTNMLVDGGNATMYFDDLTYNGKTEDFSTDPGWDGGNNRGTYVETEPHGAQNFGFSETKFSGGKPGEIGGLFWRQPTGGYYADRVGPLSLNDRLEARGRMAFLIAGTDADMRFGWFGSKSQNPPKPGGPDFLGIHIGGPTRVGHYFLPHLITSGGHLHKPVATATKPAGPVVAQKKTYEWSLIYDPQGNGGNGTLQATLADESVTLNLEPGAKSEGVVLDRFGMLVVPVSGHHVKIYLDDLKYTAREQ